MVGIVFLHDGLPRLAVANTVAMLSVTVEAVFTGLYGIHAAAGAMASGHPSRGRV
jgi:hypothetical protein